MLTSADRIFWLARRSIFIQLQWHVCEQREDWLRQQEAAAGQQWNHTGAGEEGRPVEGFLCVSVLRRHRQGRGRWRMCFILLYFFFFFFIPLLHRHVFINKTMIANKPKTDFVHKLRKGPRRSTSSCVSWARETSPQWSSLCTSRPRRSGPSSASTRRSSWWTAPAAKTTRSWRR